MELQSYLHSRKKKYMVPLKGETLPGRISTGSDLGLEGREVVGSVMIANEVSPFRFDVGTVLKMEEIIL